MSRGVLFVMSGPSGTGKGTICNELLANENNDVFLSVSSTTREKRKGETDGVTYNYTTVENFKKMIDNGEMLEYAMYSGNYYGTPKKPVEEQRAKGNDVVLEIEVQGALQVKKACPDALLIFIAPPSFEELASRLTGRQTEDSKTVENRLNIARKELLCAKEYDYIIVNDTVELAVQRLAQVISANRYSIKNMKEFLDEVNEYA